MKSGVLLKGKEMFSFLENFFKNLAAKNGKQPEVYKIEEMSFDRDSFYGVDFKWFAVDSTGAIAQFTTGHSPIPKKVFSDKESFDQANNFFENLPNRTKAKLTTKYEKYLTPSKVGFTSPLVEAKRGLFIFEEFSEIRNEKIYTTYNPEYELYAFPLKKLNIHDLTPEIQMFLSSFVIDIEFSQNSIIDVRNYFECE